MFRVTLDGVIVVYVVIILCSVFFSWLAAEVFRRGKANQRRKYIVVCPICENVYEDLTAVELPECPRCGHANEREKLTEI